MKTTSGTRTTQTRLKWTKSKVSETVYQRRREEEIAERSENFQSVEDHYEVERHPKNFGRGSTFAGTILSSAYKLTPAYKLE